MDAMDNRYGIVSEGVPGPAAGDGAEMSRAAPQSIQDLGLPSLFLGQLT